MQALIEVILPVFLVIGFGYAGRWRGWFGDEAVDGLMRFAQGVALPLLLFRAIAAVDLRQTYDLPLIVSFYTGFLVCFLAGLLGGRLLFGRPWDDAVAIGFCGMFSNSLLLGVPITERAYGAGALAGNFAVISIHAPIGYALGITVMEAVRGRGGAPLRTLFNVLKGMARSPLVVGLFCGFAVNLAGLPLPVLLDDALAMLTRAALPTALFALGGVLYRYRPEGDFRAILFICALSLVLHPLITWTLGLAFGMPVANLRSAVVTAAMAPGVNAYLFASMYGAARRVAASSVLIGTALSFLTIPVWLMVLP